MHAASEARTQGKDARAKRRSSFSNSIAASFRSIKLKITYGLRMQRSARGQTLHIEHGASLKFDLHRIYSLCVAAAAVFVAALFRQTFLVNENAIAPMIKKRTSFMGSMKNITMIAKGTSN